MSAALQKIIRLSSNYFEKYTREQPGKKTEGGIFVNLYPNFLDSNFRINEEKYISRFKNELDIRLIINGGMGEPIHAVEAKNNGADAVAAAYIFHFSK